ncbi:MAG: 16S rRNA (guanine(527)-N(7))-methyltransferase RsmG [Bacillota bacterium]
MNEPRGYRWLAEHGIRINHEMYVLLEKYRAALEEENRRQNLTRVTGREEVWEKHFADSLAILGFFDIPYGSLVIDVGTGGGLPGIPLLIVRPDIRLVLLDSERRKVEFLGEVLASLGLTAQAVWKRAEDAGRGNLRERFDAALSRAVAKVAVVAEYTLPVVRVGGAVYLFKGPGADAELAEAAVAVERLGGAIGEIRRYTLPGGEARALIRLSKVKSTPGLYPRKPGIPSKRPLGRGGKKEGADELANSGKR